MAFGAYLKQLRKRAGLSQRELEALSGISNAEISRIETGDRKKPSPISLKALAPHLGVSYAELMQRAGYIEEVHDRGSYEDVVWKNSDGEPVDSLRRSAQKIDARDSDLIRILDRAVDTSSDRDIETIKRILEGFLEGNLDDGQKRTLRGVIEGFLPKK